MTILIKSLNLMWMLALTARSAQTTNQTESQMTTQIPYSTNKTFITAHANQTTEAQTPSNIQTTNTPTNDKTSSQFNSSVGSNFTTEIKNEGITTQTILKTSNPTTATMTPLSSSTQSQNTGYTSTFLVKTTQLPTVLTQSTNLIPTTTVSTKPTNNNSSPSLKPGASLSPSPSPNPSLGQSPATSGSTVMKKKTLNQITKAKIQPDTTDTKARSSDETNHGKIVAGLIGAALIVMMLGFLVIFIKKQRLQKQQITTTDWAGPSPFLEGAAENGLQTRRSSNRISLSSFLPHRLSKRLSLLPETDEEMQDMTGGTTFGDQHPGITFGQEVDSNSVQESNGTAVGFPEIKTTEDAAESAENSVSGTSSKNNNPTPTNDNLD
ncbi:protein EVI2B [Anabas testudineus]|nr:protein EVI2B [Anabas testudineus]